MAVLILDSEALSSLARPHAHVQRARRIHQAMVSAERSGRPVRVPSTVLVEVYRGRRIDEPIDSLLGRGSLGVITVGARIARTAGHMLAAIGAGSEMAIDALVVATCERLGGGIVLTHDPNDLTLLATDHPNVRVIPI